MKELFVVKCAECKRAFKTDAPKVKVCPSCMKYRKPSKKPRAKKSAKKPLTIGEILHIGEVYYKVNHEHLHYGDVVALVENSVDRCVCCGEVVPEGRQVCPLCEKAGGL